MFGTRRASWNPRPDRASPRADSSTGAIVVARSACLAGGHQPRRLTVHNRRHDLRSGVDAIGAPATGVYEAAETGVDGGRGLPRSAALALRAGSRDPAGSWRRARRPAEFMAATSQSAGWLDGL